MTQELTTTNNQVTPSEWQMITQQATALASSKIVPEAYRNKPDDIISAALMGREVGWSPVLSLKYINVIKGTPSTSAEGMTALVRRNGHSIQIVETTPERAVVKGVRADNGDEYVSTFTMEDARTAKLDGSFTYKQHPAQMLQWRAVSRLCRFLFPDCIAGLGYTPDEAHEINAEPERMSEHQIMVIGALAAAAGQNVNAWQNRARRMPVEAWETTLYAAAETVETATGKPLETIIAVAEYPDANAEYIIETLTTQTVEESDE